MKHISVKKKDIKVRKRYGLQSLFELVVIYFLHQLLYRNAAKSATFNRIYPDLSQPFFQTKPMSFHGYLAVWIISLL